jgi:hypothetical protein
VGQANQGEEPADTSPQNKSKKLNPAGRIRRITILVIILIKKGPFFSLIQSRKYPIYEN